ncbi:hypothetical protein BZA70DRAFT_166575 [Myxozyma melibiosi]|uniref:Uncharacterized protein n=1 Tax=Myxozyma melibiosi TaxID=54550 RepID=A0ABR1F4X8_9ASCO
MTDDESLVNSPRIHANSAAYEVLSEGDKSEISEPDDADLYDEEIVPWFEITPNDSPDDRTRSTEPVIQNADEMTSATTVKNGNHHPVQDPAIYKSSLDDDPDDGNRDPSLSQVAPVQSQVIRSTKPPSLASATPQRLGNAGLTLKTRRSLNSKTKNPPISKKPLGSGLQLEFLYLVETTSGHLTELSAFKRSWACDGKSLALSADVLAAKAIVTGDFSGFGDEEPVALPYVLALTTDPDFDQLCTDLIDSLEIILKPDRKLKKNDCGRSAFGLS